MPKNKTSFKTGHAPCRYSPVGTEKVNIEGYILIKTADPNTWERKHVKIYKEAYGEIPKGQIVIFADGNKRNFNIDNLLLITRRELVTLNRNRLIKSNSDLTKTGLLIADIHIKINERKRSI